VLSSGVSELIRKAAVGVRWHRGKVSVVASESPMANKQCGEVVIEC
jgi:hypothetical protein